MTQHMPVVVGLLVVALLAGGVYWVRTRQTTLAGPSSATPHAGVSTAHEAVPDITQQPGSSDDGDGRITVTLAPARPRAHATMHVSVLVERAGLPVAFEHGHIRFDMTMPMGDHRYRLVAGSGAAPGVQTADVTLPWCLSGKRRWYATVDVMVDGRPRTARFRFDLAPPQ